MTFEELVKQVTKNSGLTTTDGRPAQGAVERIIRDALRLAADAAKNGHAPVFPGIGRFAVVSVRSTGRNPDGSTWTRPGRTKLALRASYKRGGRQSVKSMEALVPAAVGAA
jgi:hypothetical protein